MIYIFGPTTGIKPKKLTMFELVLTYIQLIFSVGLMWFSVIFALYYPTMANVPQGLSFMLTLIFMLSMLILIYSMLKLLRHWKSKQLKCKQLK